MLFSSAVGTDAGCVLCAEAVVSNGFGRSHPVNNAEKIWISQRMTPIHIDENCGAIMPKMNAGPALLQYPIKQFAVRRSITLLWYALAISWAPTGYPPKKPKSKIVSAPDGIFKCLKIFANPGNFMPAVTSQR